MIVRLSSNESRCEEVLKHLRAVDGEFTPPLSLRVNLDEYAGKLSEQAERDEAWSGNELVALVATYYNDRERGAYISNVSVLKAFQRQGLADALIRIALERAREQRLPMVTLHLHQHNRAASALYHRLGFSKGAIEGNQQKMTLHLDRS